MSNEEKSTIRLERMYGKGAVYLNVPYTRNMSSNTHRIQAVLGRWKDIGVGHSEEEAREAAAEALIERISESRTPRRDKHFDLRKENDRLIKRLKKLELTTKELGVIAIEKIMNKIRGNEDIISPFETIDLQFEAIEIFATFGIALQVRQFQREKETGVAMTIDSEKDSAKTVLEFHENPNLAELAALLGVLYSVQGSLGIQIREMLQAEEIIKKHEQAEKETETSKRRWGRGQNKK